MSRLYSKLYKEAEKIKKWKVDVDSELKQKENKLQENRKIVEAQRKAIQELQFENEKVSLKLEEGIQENKDLIKDYYLIINIDSYFTLFILFETKFYKVIEKKQRLVGLQSTYQNHLSRTQDFAFFYNSLGMFIKDMGKLPHVAM
ncbi:Synaptonemal Complex Protein 1 [Manis pentadactyla]|nr:Synaptonemal Complex Protein 1 [Manis pentadactyla]